MSDSKNKERLTDAIRDCLIRACGCVEEFHSEDMEIWSRCDEIDEWIEQLQAENERLNKILTVLASWFDGYAGYAATHPAAPKIPGPEKEK